jgi:hypothetical protein
MIHTCGFTESTKSTARQNFAHSSACFEFDILSLHLQGAGASTLKTSSLETFVSKAAEVQKHLMVSNMHERLAVLFRGLPN